MPVNTAVPTSRRMYLSEDELEQFADITVTDSTEGSDRISQAEEIIDAYVGFQEKHVTEPIFGQVSAANNTTFTMETTHQNVYDINYLEYCEVEIVSGTGQGQRRTITGNTKAGVVTIQSAWSVNPDTSSFYNIYQLGKFPRFSDVQFHNPSLTFVKSIPEAVKRAVAAQVQYAIEVGESFFSGDKVDMTRERIGDYEYEVGNGNVASSLGRMASPKARLLLNGITNRKGQLMPNMSFTGLLNQSITLYPKTSYNSQGREVTGSGTTYRARVERKTKRKLMDNGQLVLIDLIVFVKPDFPGTIDDRIDYGSNKYRIFNKYDTVGANGEVHHIELQLIRWRQA